MKYLIISLSIETKSIDHALELLKKSIAEAIFFNRNLVIGTFSIKASGNLGHTLKNMNYNRFIDLSKTQICTINSGNIKQINKALSYTDAENFNINEYSDDEVLLLKDSRTITPELNNRYKVISRRITTEYVNSYPDILVRFHASSEIDQLTDTVLRTMNTSLSNVKIRNSIHYGVDYSANQDSLKKKKPLHPTYYACLHIPHNNYSMTPTYAYSTSRRQIKKTFTHLNIKKQTTVYMILDTPETKDYDSLKKYCQLYSYYDFPELRALISGDYGQEINYAMLYSVEKNLLQYAAIKIIPFQPLSGLPIIYNDSSHNIPLRYALSASCRYWKKLLSCKKTIDI